MSASSDERAVRAIFASASVGAGHNQAAAALLEALRRRAGPDGGEFVDALAHTPGWFRLLYAGSYTLMVTRLRWAYALGYRLTGCLGRRASRDRLRLLVERVATRGFRRWLGARGPALVVCTHYLPMPVAARLSREQPGRFRTWVVVTDYEAHRFWYADGIERYLVAREAVADQLARWGVPRDRIAVAGIPVHPKWTDPVDAGRARRDWDLPEDRPIVLVSGGAYFTVGPVERIARGIAAGSDAHVVVLAGSNKELLARLASLPEAERITGVPWTDRAHELAELASIVVTKAGGLTVTECMAKAAAMVLTRPVPGQEAANARMLEAAGAAVVAPTAEEVIAATVRLLRSPAEAVALGAAAGALYRPAAHTIAGQVLDALDRRPADPPAPAD